MNKHLFVIFFMTVHGSVWAPVSDGSEVVGSASPVEQRRVMPQAGCLADFDGGLIAGVPQQHAQQQLVQNSGEDVPVQTGDDCAAQLAELRVAQR